MKIGLNLAFSGHIARYTATDFLGGTKAAEACRKQIEVFAPLDSTVLITGESGTGKEIVAQSIHNASRRANGPFVAVNCSAVSASLLESELFGYDDGAFTGAKKGGKTGLFEQAHKGTIFLDEIGDISLEFQASLLRVIQEREVRRIGSDKNINVDVRILAATNVDLNKKVKQGIFRLDLFYRLCVLHINIAPLRERRDDIALLAQHFCLRSGGSPIVFAKKLLQDLLSYNWPGNVRELQNYAERAALLFPNMSAAEVFQNHLELHRERNIKSVSAVPIPVDSLLVKKGTLFEMENQILTKLYAECNRNKTILAERLNISRVTVWNRLKTAKITEEA